MKYKGKYIVIGGSSFMSESTLNDFSAVNAQVENLLAKNSWDVCSADSFDLGPGIIDRLHKSEDVNWTDVKREHLNEIGLHYGSLRVGKTLLQEEMERIFVKSIPEVNSLVYPKVKRGSNYTKPKKRNKK